MRRIMAAWVYDYVLCLWLATGIVVIAKACSLRLEQFVPLQVMALTIFVFRETLTGQGSSPGKLIAGLKLVDSKTGKAPAVWQSARRSLVLLGPYFAYQIILALASTAPSQSLNAFVLPLLQSIACLLTGALGLYELTAMSKNDGRRLADRIGSTAVTLRATAAAVECG